MRKRDNGLDRGEVAGELALATRVGIQGQAVLQVCEREREREREGKRERERERDRERGRGRERMEASYTRRYPVHFLLVVTGGGAGLRINTGCFFNHSLPE